MSNDSSNKKSRAHGAQHTSPKGALVSQASRGAFAPSRTLKEKYAAIRARGQWGIIGGAFFGLLALFGPWYLLAPLLSYVLPYVPVSLNLKLSIANVVVITLSFLLVVATLFAYGKKLRSIGFTKLTWQFVAKALGAFVLYFLLSAILADAAHALIPYNQEQPQNLGYHGLNGLELVIAFIPLVILTPLAEESIFRGFMFTGFRRHVPFWAAALGVSAIFGLAHGQVNVGLDVFVLSMVSCYLRESTQSLWPSIFLHAIKNGVAFYLLYLYNGG